METPRTNSNAGYYYGHGIKKNADLVIDPNGPFVRADFARELERELAEMTARAVSLVMHLQPETLAGDVQRWRDEAKRLLANAKAEGRDQ